jgi:hypothetical protein
MRGLLIASTFTSLALVVQLQTGPASRVSQLPPPASCPATTPITGTPPQDPNAEPFWDGPWYVNAARTLWVDAPRSGTMATGQRSWIRPQGKQLTGTATRLDADAPPLLFEERVGSYPTGFYFGSPDFPTEGCWEVTVKAGQSELTYVIPIRYSIEAFAARPTTRATWSKEVGRIENGDARVVVTAVVLEDPASVTRSLRGARIDLTDGMRTDRVYEEELRLEGTRGVLESWIEGRSPMVYGFGRAYNVNGNASKVSFSSGTLGLAFPGHSAAEFVALLVRAGDELRGR